MFKNMKLAAKLAMGFGVVVVIVGVLGFFGWQGANTLGNHLKEYTEWSNIDMIMNEEVTQNCLALDNALTLYKANPGEDTWQRLDNAFTKVDEGLAEWGDMVAHLPDLSHAGENIKRELETYNEVVEGYRTNFQTQSEIQEQWDDLIEECLAHLLTTMEEVIDPAKEMFEKVEDVPQMVKWGAIDMVMNEGVIANTLKLQTAAHDYAADGSEEAWQMFIAAQQAADEGLTEWRETLAGESQMETAADKVSAYFANYAKLSDRYHDAFAELHAMEQRIGAAGRAMYAELERGMEEVLDPAKQAVEDDARAVESQITSVAMILAFCGIALGIILAYLITRSITRPINKIIEQLDTGSDQVSSASSQVASSSQQMAEGASEQASSLEETSASMQEMGSMSRQNADNAREANNLSGQTAEAATTGNEAMTRMSQAIDDIKKSSDETAKIIKTIDEIAFQTNLLALNAAVEAARAGEAGKGFAVVAEEVRNLAMRSAEAARTTNDMIEGSQKNADKGVQVSQEVAESLGTIVNSVQKVTGLINEISAASDEQAKGVDQINAAMSQMDQVTQSNASNAEESASASEELNAQAQELKKVVQDLQEVVGGQGSTAGRTATTTRKLQDKWEQPRTHQVQDRVQSLLHRKKSHPATKPGNGGPKGRHAAPEDLIPLEEGEREELEDAFTN
jgi:methyl-accepting chemotaxis protein